MRVRDCWPCDLSLTSQRQQRSECVSRNCRGGYRPPRRVWTCRKFGQSESSPPCTTAAKRKRVSAQRQEKDGWLRHQENFAKPPKQTQPGWFSFSIHRNTTPASGTADASRYFLDRSATPPRGYARRGIRSSGTILTFRVQRLCCEEVRNSERKSDSVAPGGKMSKL